MQEILKLIEEYGVACGDSRQAIDDGPTFDAALARSEALLQRIKDRLTPCKDTLDLLSEVRRVVNLPAIEEAIMDVGKL